MSPKIKRTCTKCFLSPQSTQIRCGDRILCYDTTHLVDGINTISCPHWDISLDDKKMKTFGSGKQITIEDE